MAKKERDLIQEALMASQSAVDAAKGNAAKRLLREERSAAHSGMGSLPDSPGRFETGRIGQQSMTPEGFRSTGDPDWDWLIKHESSGKTTAKNPKSSAFGLGQLLRGNRESYGRKLGIDPDTVKYSEQLELMNAYIKERYGTPAKARAFWEKNGYY